jgi:heterodisulfide reductase subunit A
VGQHPNIRLLTLSEVVAVEGEQGHFRAHILCHPRYVVEEKCVACGSCAIKCPVSVSNEFDCALSERKAIYIPSPQAVPAVYRLDRDACTACGQCAKACRVGAIDYDQTEEMVEVVVGAIVVATGYALYRGEVVRACGHGTHPDVLNGLEFERLLSASGPTGGQVLRPSDGKEPKEVVFVQCAGSRDPEHGVPYCSKICCMYSAKHAVLYKHRVHDGQAYVFYIDVRAGGKGYEEFVTRAMEDERTIYIRGRVSKVFPQQGKIVVWGVDTLAGRKVEIAADMVVLAAAILPAEGSRRVAEMLGIKVDAAGFYVSADGDLAPTESGVPGVFLAGAGVGPQDIPEAVAQASGAAAKVLRLFRASESEEGAVA